MAESVVLSSTADVTNASGASIEASGGLSIAATGRLTNAGRLVANDTVRLQADTVDNTGTGAIFGDRIAIAATTLNNRPAAAGGTAPVIAARERLDIGVQTLNNEDGALLYSDGALAIGGALDATGTATGQVQALNNVSAGIEANDRHWGGQRRGAQHDAGGDLGHCWKHRGAHG